MSKSIFQEIFLSTARKIPVENEIFWRFHVVVKGRNLIGSLTMGIEKPKLFIALNVLGGFFVLLDVTMDICHGKFISGKSTRTHYANFPQ